MPSNTVFTSFPIFTTERLYIRQVQLNDTEALFAIKSDEEVTIPYGQEPHQSPEQTRNWIQQRLVDYAQQDALAWGITFKDDDTLIGSCVLFNFDPHFYCAELGYELHRSYWQQGIVSEAASALLNYGFTEMGLHRIEANPLARNTASRKLLLKLGFTYEGTLRQRIYFRGQFEDQDYFGLLNPSTLQ